MFVKVHKFIKKTHSYFSKSNFRLLSLLGIAFAIIITLGLIQQQQDIRQQAAELHTACDSTTKTKHTCSYSGSSPEYTYLSSSVFGPQLGSCPSDTVCVQSGSCIDCKPAQHSFCNKAGGDTNYGCSSSGYSPEYTYLSSTLYGPQLGSCGSGSVCVQSGSCIDCRVLYGTGDLPPNPNTGSGGSGNSGNTGNLTPGEAACGKGVSSTACGSPGYFCCGTDKCGTDNQCYPQSTGGGTGGSGGSTGGTVTCSGSDFACNGKCYAGCPSGGTCTNNNPVCNNNGCAAGNVLAPGTDKCCPSNNPNLCSDGFCKVSCNFAEITPDPRPSTFTLTSPNMDCNSATLSWGISTGATSYIVETYIDPSQLPSQKSPALTTTTYKVTGLSPNTIYYFGIVANGTDGLKRTLVVNGTTTATCKTTGGGTTSSTKKTPTASTSTGTGSSASPVPPKTSNPTITTTVAPSITANTATLSLSLTLPGVGNASEFKNPNPKRTQRTVSVAAIDTNNTAVTAQNNLTFDSSSNSYKGTVSIPSLPAGTYTIKVRFDNTLWKKLPGNIVITNGNNNPTSTTAQLISGDLDQNNSLNVLDYTNFVKCYKGLSSCTTTLATLADLDDDGSAKDDLDDLTILQQGFNTQTQGD